MLFYQVIVAVMLVQVCAAVELEQAREQYRTGKYVECMESASAAIEEHSFSMEWQMLFIRSQMALGLYEGAADSAEKALSSYTYSIRMMRLAYDAYRSVGKLDKARDILRSAYDITSRRRIGYMTGREMVALGDMMLLMGGEPRQVLDQFYNRVLSEDPNCVEAYKAVGELAISKLDYDLASRRFREAIARFPDDPDLYVGLARSFYESDRAQMLTALQKALDINPNHAGALVLLAEHQIDCEDYRGAFDTLDAALLVNPWQPRAWAYESLLAEFGNDPNGAADRRAKALKYWPTNPEVDYLIGRKLSQNYRFTEGASHQRQALAFDPNYLPAKLQLAGDLLRLGVENDGWALARDVYSKDLYNVEAFNLVNLQRSMSAFKTISKDGFVVRMDPKEADVYGSDVLDLLHSARKDLCEKYGCKLKSPVTVELFTKQQDFAVRTFGMPGGDGFLGVCFGNVITANSPTLQRPSNWKSMLWHEFCHVVTLNLTENKMPRWISEGISVYEEKAHDPTWGQSMTPQYRQMIEQGQLTPVSQLSAAFMNPPSAIHLQFAYYESSLVVKFLIDNYGMDKLRDILDDLRNGDSINEAISHRITTITQFEKQFDEYAHKLADSLGPGVDWSEPPRDEIDMADPNALAGWISKHPDNYWALRIYSGLLLADEKWQPAEEPLKKLIELYPQDSEDDNPYLRLAVVYRNLGRTDDEVAILKKLAAISDDSAAAYLRLMEIDVKEKQWRAAIDNGRRYLAVYPMLGSVYQKLGLAYEATGDDSDAVRVYRQLLQLDPGDPVDVHYRLAKLLIKTDKAAARRHILEALADAPRFREGQKLLMQIIEQTEHKNEQPQKSEPVEAGP